MMGTATPFGVPQGVPPVCCTPSYLLLVAALFAAAYGQAPLYYSNQNQYFLHALAQLDRGFLREDWLAQTLDPTPLFTLLVRGCLLITGPWIFHALHVFMLGIYAFALLDMIAFLAGSRVTPRRWFLFTTLFVFIHSALARWASYKLFGNDFAWYFQAGVASQYVLGGMFQPSVFGVLLVMALRCFVRGQWVLAGICLAGACVMHNTYLLPAAMLICGMMVQLLLEKQPARAGALAVLTLVLVLPSVIRSWLTFAPTTPEQFAAAQDILANFRIPHHARIDYWLDGVAVCQIAWVLLGIVLARRTRLFGVLLFTFMLAVLTTLVQAWAASDFLALLFPWRISTVLVPAATAVVLARLCGLSLPSTAPSPVVFNRAPMATMLGWCGMLGLAVAGMVFSFGRLAFQSPVEDLPVMDFVRDSCKSGEVYLLHVSLPDRSKRPVGFIRSLSSDFKPPPEKIHDSRLIPLDLQQFRLYTGAAIFVDFKAIPYKDVEVLAWRHRLEVARNIQEQIQAGQLDAVPAKLRELGITHVVQPARETPLNHPGFRLIFGPASGEQGRYRVYRVDG